MSAMIYLFRVIVTVLLMVIYVITKNGGIVFDGLESQMVAFAESALTQVVCVAAILLPFEIFVRKRHLGILVNISPGLAAIYEVFLFFVLNGFLSSKEALPGFLVVGALCGMVWAFTSFLNGPQHTRFANSRGAHTT